MKSEVNKVFDYDDLVGSYTASNYDFRFTDLIFITDDGCKITFKNVPAPEGWNGSDDWVSDKYYVMSALHGMTFDVEDVTGFENECYYK